MKLHHSGLNRGKCLALKSLCVRWLGLVVCEEGLVMLFLLESVHQLSWVLRFKDFCFRGVFARHWHSVSNTHGNIFTLSWISIMTSQRIKVCWTLMCTCCVTGLHNITFITKSLVIKVIIHTSHVVYYLLKPMICCGWNLSLCSCTKFWYSWLIKIALFTLPSLKFFVN